MSFLIGAGLGRWAPTTFDDVVRAAGEGLLDETQWVELKETLPAGNRATNLELARDLAALAVEGGLLVIGVQDNGNKAGPVTGTPLAGIEDRIDQVARDRVTPPLIVRCHVLHHPEDENRGCVLVVVDASADAPHMVDDRYWGRGSTGKRALTDTEVRRLIADRLAKRRDFTTTFRDLRDASPLDAPGTIHHLVTPRGGRDGVMSDLVDRASHLQQFCHTATDIRPYRWRLDDLITSRRRFTGIELTNYGSARPSIQDAHDPRDLADINAKLMTLTQDGHLHFACTGLVYDTESHRGPHRELSSNGVIELTQQLVAVAGLIAQAAGHSGTWDVGISLDGLAGARLAPSHGQIVGPYGATFADPQYTAVTTISTAHLVTQQSSVVAGLLRPLLAVVGAENRVPTP